VGAGGRRAALISSITQIPAGIVLVDVRTSLQAPNSQIEVDVCLLLSVRAPALNRHAHADSTTPKKLEMV
jgi:hypothetical protein